MPIVEKSPRSVGKLREIMVQSKSSPFSSQSYGFAKVVTPRGTRPCPPAGSRNLRLTISYNGHGYCGYQYQPHGHSVQEVLTLAWRTLTREQIILFGCSRLDAGVSASHFVLNVYTATALDCETILRKLNGILQSGLREAIHVFAVDDADPLFHARFDTVGKHYRYLLWHGFGSHALLTPRAWLIRAREAPVGLAEALQEFVGEHDFRAFRAQDCTAKSTHRTIHRIDFWHHPRFSQLAVVDVWGDGFLKNQIRNMVGTAVDIAIGKLTFATIAEAFNHGERVKVGQCAPGHALTLERVYYEPETYAAEVQRGNRGL